MKKVLSLLLAYIFLQTQIWAIGGGPAGQSVSAISLVGTYAGALLPDSVTNFGTGTTGTGTTGTTGTGTTGTTGSGTTGDGTTGSGTTGDGTSGDENSDQFNGLGLFTLGLPVTGLGTGGFVYFSEGRTFTGTITGLADPGRGTFVGLVKGQFDVVVDSTNVNDDFFGDFSSTSTIPGGFANGTINARFTAGVGAIVGGGSGVRIEGDSRIEISELKTTTITDDQGTEDDTADDVVTTSTTVTTTSALTLVVDGFQQSTLAVDSGTSSFSSFGTNTTGASTSAN